MKHFVTRTCTEYSYDESKRVSVQIETKNLHEYKEAHAYVLLGEPGIGKTISFEEEKRQLEPNAEYVTARDLITFETKGEWRGKTLFIDGLDEVRAGTQDVRSPFDAIRKCLENLGCPKFRLSCREADWRESDKTELQKVVPEGETILELHLNELTEDDINEILIKNYKNEVGSSDEFINQAKNRGLFELIKNPQILKMLVSAISDSGDWPDSRQKTFELACRKILFSEHNQEHTDAGQNQAQAIDKQLEAAGYLCALLLFSDKPGFSRTAVSATDDFHCTNELEYDDVKLLNTVSKTKLFSSTHDRFKYVHRTVAEYLSAYYLKKQIDEKGLPVGRVLALLTGKDGHAVTALRGLFAWLVTLLEQERPMLIKRDPLGLILYGDVKSFSVADKTKILDALKEEAIRYPYFRSANWVEYPFGALCAIDMEPVFSEILNSSDRSDEQQALVDCVLDAMMHGDCLTTLINCLPEFIRDSSRKSNIRRQALHIFIKHLADKPESNEKLRPLIEDINNNTVQDQDDDLLGVLLEELYPNVIKPSKIFDYLHTPKKSNYLGQYEYFWSMYLSELSTDEMLFVLLDELVLRKENLMPIFDKIHFSSMVGNLLNRGLNIYDPTISIEKLSNWLGLGLDKYNSMFLTDEDGIKQIRDWIGSYPEYQKAIIELHVEECMESDEFDWCMRKAIERFYYAEPPIDYGLWCLKKAEESTKDLVSKYFVAEAISTLYREKGNQGLSLELLEQVVLSSPRLAPWVEEMLIKPIDRGDRKFKLKQQERREKEQQQKHEYIQFVKDHLDDIQKGEASSNILYNLGMAYYGRFIDFKGETPYERLNNYFEDEIIVDSILTGLKKCLERQDIPEVDEIFQLNMNGEIYHLSLPVRAGLEELSKENIGAILNLPEQIIRKILAFYYADGLGNDAVWYMALVKEYPKLVSEIFVEYGLTAIRSKKEHVSGFWPLAFDKKHSNIARYASILLLTGFPARSTNKQLESLDYLLKAAFLYADNNDFRKLIKKKLKLCSMNIAQRAHWLGIAFIIDSSKYKKQIVEFFDENIQRIKYFAGLLSYRGGQVSLVNDLSESALGTLIQLFGCYYLPRNWDTGGGLVTAAMHNSDLINSMINKLATINSDAATKVITGLIEETKLNQWHRTLQGALFQQQANKREADFSHPDIKQVCITFNNLAPANVSDLAALVFDHIRDLANQIRNSDTDDYRQYWNIDYENSRLVFTKRKHEDICRDTFLSDLKERMKTLGIVAKPEGHYAEDKRADVYVSFVGTVGFNVPIEIKCNDHKNLWYAVHEQLIAKYSRDPGAHGYGIYLVFWFGAERTPPPPEGTRPKTAKELEIRLKERLNTKEERQQISICVIDCSVSS